MHVACLPLLPPQLSQETQNSPRPFDAFASLGRSQQCPRTLLGVFGLGHTYLCPLTSLFPPYFPPPFSGFRKGRDPYSLIYTRFWQFGSQNSLNQVTELSYSILVYQKQTSCILKNFWVSPDFQTYMLKRNTLQHLELTLSCVPCISCNSKLFFLFLSQIFFFLNKEELGYGDAYITLVAGICSSGCQNMIACCFDRDVVTLLRSFKFCFRAVSLLLSCCVVLFKYT